MSYKFSWLEEIFWKVETESTFKRLNGNIYRVDFNFFSGKLDQISTENFFYDSMTLYLYHEKLFIRSYILVENMTLQVD